MLNKSTLISKTNNLLNLRRMHLCICMRTNYTFVCYTIFLHIKPHTGVFAVYLPSDPLVLMLFAEEEKNTEKQQHLFIKKVQKFALFSKPNAWHRNMNAYIHTCIIYIFFLQNEMRVLKSTNYKRVAWYFIIKLNHLFLQLLLPLPSCFFDQKNVWAQCAHPSDVCAL